MDGQMVLWDGHLYDRYQHVECKILIFLYSRNCILFNREKEHWSGVGVRGLKTSSLVSIQPQLECLDGYLACPTLKPTQFQE